MKRAWPWFLIVVVFAVLAVGGYFVATSGMLGNRATVRGESSSQSTQTAAVSPSAAPTSARTDAAASSAPLTQTVVATIVADARVVPVESADLSMMASGIVDRILVDEGDQVAKGDLLMRLDAAKQQAAVTQAQAQLQRAQAQLDQVNAGARTEEIAAAEAALAAATARRDRIANAAGPGQIAQAEAALSASNAALSRLYEGPRESEISAARARLQSAEAAMTQAQRAYDLVSSRNDIGALPQSAQLQQTTIAWEEAKAQLALLESGPTVAQVAGASADVRRQQASLDTLQNALPTDLQAAEADVAANQAQLDLLRAGARPEQIAAAEADVAAATATLQQALVSLADTELRAPFDGSIAQWNVEVGEQVAPGVPVLSMANLDQWQIETEDLTELDAVHVQPGTPVQLAFDALPDLTMGGTVQYVRPRGGDNRGDIVYTAVITPDEQDSRLLWNMTAVVTVE